MSHAKSAADPLSFIFFRARGLISHEIQSSLAVIPAKAGIHLAFCIRATWIPAFAGMTAGEI
jgi:hypothetical protein